MVLEEIGFAVLEFFQILLGKIRPCSASAARSRRILVS